MIRTLLAAALAASMPLAAAAKVSLDEASRYLNSFSTAKGKFTQVADDGSIATGNIAIRRPGRVRFEYDAPLKQLVVAGAGQVLILDGKSNTGGEQYPLSQTPLSIILADNVNLGRARMVTGHSSDGTKTTITAQDPDNPGYGNIQLVFTEAPTQLRQWIVTDQNGSRTTVVLGDLATGVNLPASTFSLEQAKASFGR